MLEAFKQFLGTKERLPEKNIHYYVKWVSDCYRYFDVHATQSLTNEQNIEFINHLAKKHEDWQVQQADRALTIQELLGHANLQTTMIYTHVATKNILGVRSPLDK